MLQYGLTLAQPLHQPAEFVSEVADRRGGEPEEVERVDNERSRQLPRTQVRIAQTQLGKLANGDDLGGAHLGDFLALRGRDAGRCRARDRVEVVD